LTQTSHVGLNNDARWEDFREIELADQQMFHQLLASMNVGPEFAEENGGASGNGKSRRFDTGMNVVDEIVSHFITHSFLDPKDDRVLETILNQPIPGTPLKFRDITDAQTLREKLLEAQKRLPQQEPEEFAVQPQDERVTLQKRLDERGKSVANRLLQDLNAAFHADRQLYIRLVETPCRRATTETWPPSASTSASSAALCSGLHCRRRSTTTTTPSTPRTPSGHSRRTKLRSARPLRLHAEPACRCSRQRRVEAS